MSYDLMVFNPDKAPRNEAAFLEWYDGQTEWTEDHSYNDPQVTSPELKSWFMEMIKYFPPLNGPYAPDDIDNLSDEEDEKITDHCIGHDVIYSGFRWSVAEMAYPIMLELARKHRVGFFDASGTGIIMFPNDSGELESINKSTKSKPWWKFW